MNRYSRRVKSTFRQRVIITGVLLVSMLALIYFIPRETKFGYEYELDRPWRYSQLIASYDFPLYKTEAELKAEHDSLLRTFRPFYMLDLPSCERKLAELKADFASGNIQNVPLYYLPRIEKLLLEIYNRGIVSSNELERLRKEGTTHILLLKGAVATERDVESLLTPVSAYEQAINAESSGIEREILDRCKLRNYLVGNLQYDKERTERERSELLQVLPTSGMVQSGQLIIDRGQIVTAEQMKILDSLKLETERRTDPSTGYWLVVLGQSLFVVSLLLLFYFYLRLFRRDYLLSTHSLLLLFTLLVIFPIITFVLVDRHLFSVYLVPYAIVPIFARIFMDSRTAFVSMIVSLLLSSIALYAPYEFILLQTVTGMTAIYSLRELTERSQLLRTAAVATFVGVVVMLAYELSHGTDLESLNLSRCTHMAIGGVLLLFAYPLMYLFEKVFGFTSSVTLVELTNINHPLLRKMSKVAQGTFNHSMQVANLAAEVADKIGAKVQLVRTGALYHDIGKMSNPAFFTENQSGVNPHNELTEHESAEIIVSHVTEGLKMAEKYHLPEVLKSFITTHHGAGMAKYFYIQYVNKHPDEEVDPAPFRYPGPNPTTPEQAVLMMCDSVEAASRSLKDYTEESISQLVNKIIDNQLSEGYFKECPITFRDIADAKSVLIESLKTIYHTRIAYPERKQ